MKIWSYITSPSGGWIIIPLILVVGLLVYYSGITRKAFSAKHFDRLSENEERLFSIIWPFTILLLLSWYILVLAGIVLDKLRDMRI